MLYENILKRAVENRMMNVDISNIQKDVDNICYNALNEIYEVINDQTLEDTDCFYRIEEIVRIYEKLGCLVNRHDF